MAHTKLFPSQLPNEKIVLVVREHWFRLFIKVFVIAVLSLLPFAFKSLLVDTNILEVNNTLSLIVSVVDTVYYLGLLVGLYVVFVLYYLNIHIVSEQRVVDIDQRSLLSREVSELNIETIEDVSSHTKGVFGNLLDYGTVFVQTAGGTERFEFDNVPNPTEIASTILDLYEKHGDKQSTALARKVQPPL